MNDNKENTNDSKYEDSSESVDLVQQLLLK